MSAPTRSAFTLIELLVTLSILALLAVLLTPSLASARDAARETACLNNLRGANQAVAVYLGDSKDVYPIAPGTLLQTVNLFGKTGSSASSGGNLAASRRLLNKYINDNTNLAQCPLDRGTNTPVFTNNGNCFDGFGSSYVYLDRDPATSLRRRNNVWAIEGHRASDIKVTPRKMILADFTLIRSSLQTKHHWHNRDPLLQGSMGYADGHAAQTTYKIDGVGNYANATQTQIDTWARNDPYY